MEFINRLCERILHITDLMISDVGYDPETSGFTISRFPFLTRICLSPECEFVQSLQLREIQRRMAAISGVGFRSMSPEFGDLVPFYMMDTGQVLHLHHDTLRYILIDYHVEVVVVPCVMVEEEAEFLEWQVVCARVTPRT